MLRRIFPASTLIVASLNIAAIGSCSSSSSTRLREADAGIDAAGRGGSSGSDGAAGSAGTSGDGGSTRDDGGSTRDDGGSTRDDGGSTRDDGGSERCDAMRPFQNPTRLPVVNSDAVLTGGARSAEHDARLSADGLTLFFASTRNVGASHDLFFSTRASTSADFNLPDSFQINGADQDSDPSISDDGLTFLFQRKRAGMLDKVYIATRNTALAPFVAPVPATINGDPSVSDADPYLVQDGSLLLFVSTRGGNRDIYFAERTSSGFSGPEPLTSVNSPELEANPVLTADKLTLYFSSTRPATAARGGYDIWRAERATASDPNFGTPELVTELNSPTNDGVSYLSADDCTVYLDRDVAGDVDIYAAERPR